MSKGRVLVAMSGGVDSSVAAALLVEQGYEVIGVTMQVWDYTKTECSLEEGNGTCCSSIDVDDARAVADHLNIPFYVVNCEEKFQEKVIDNFVDNYLKGETPIPCVHCNTYLKFDHLIRKMNELECDYIATGHYAQVQESPITGKKAIVTSSDSWKDQTYFLFTMQDELIPKLMFPVGHLEKPALRKMAEEMGLPVAQKKDSVGICFIGKGDYSKFVGDRAQPEQITKGEIKVHPTGEVLSTHEGIHNFTYGQRRGLGVSYKEPLYVYKIEGSTVWLSEEKYLYGNKMTLRDVNLMDEVKDGETLKVKIRFQHKGSEALVKRDGEKFHVEFSEPQRSITPGQAAVFYREKQLIGGGWII